MLKQQKKMELRKKQMKWEQKLSSSPFTVNLVADSERLEEEHNVRVEEEARRRKMVDVRSAAAKQDIILRALQEESDLEALRREKRAIMEEEYRLKVKYDLMSQWCWQHAFLSHFIVYSQHLTFLFFRLVYTHIVIYMQALLDLEKTNSHAKADRLAAVRAEKMRHSTKAEYKRQQNLDAINDLRSRERELLVMKHALEEQQQSSGTFGGELL
jgi:hypothetical protein